MHPSRSEFSGSYVVRHDPLQDAPPAPRVLVLALASALSGAVTTALAFTLWRFL